MPDDILTSQLAQEQLEALGEPLRDKRVAVSNILDQVESSIISAATDFAGFMDMLGGPNDIAAGRALLNARIAKLETAFNNQEWRVRQYIKQVIETLAIDGDV